MVLKTASEIDFLVSGAKREDVLVIPEEFFAIDVDDRAPIELIEIRQRLRYQGTNKYYGEKLIRCDRDGLLPRRNYRCTAEGEYRVLNNREIAVYHELPLNGTAKVIYHILMEATPDPVAIRPPPPPPPPEPEPEPEPVAIPTPEPVYTVVRTATDPNAGIVNTTPANTIIQGLPTLRYMRVGVDHGIIDNGPNLPLESNATQEIASVKDCPEDFMEIARPKVEVEAKTEKKPKKTPKQPRKARKKK